MSPEQICKAIAAILDSKKAENIIAIETTELTIVSDYFVLASGTSSTHTKALAEDLEFEMKKQHGIAPHNIEGRATGWILLDYGSVIVHVFQKDQREYYNLERLWNDASQLDLSDVLTD